MIGTLLDIIKARGVFATGCCEWHKRPVTEHTLANFKEHFKHQNENPGYSPHARQSDKGAAAPRQ
jgi:hypothetical protein